MRNRKRVEQRRRQEVSAVSLRRLQRQGQEVLPSEPVISPARFRDTLGIRHAARRRAQPRGQPPVSHLAYTTRCPGTKAKPTRLPSAGPGGTRAAPGRRRYRRGRGQPARVISMPVPGCDLPGSARHTRSVARERDRLSSKGWGDEGTRQLNPAALRRHLVGHFVETGGSMPPQLLEAASHSGEPNQLVRPKRRVDARGPPNIAGPRDLGAVSRATHLR